MGVETSTLVEPVKIVGKSAGKNLGKPKRPTPPGKAENWTPETAREMSARGKVTMALQREAGRKIGPLSREEWEALAHRPAFQGNWYRAFLLTLRNLKKQYAPPGSTETAQYALLIERLAACYTMAWRMQAEDTERVAVDLILKLDDQIRNYIAQIQKYTESEKRELTVRDEVQQSFLSTAVVLAEATIQNLQEREAYLVALMRQFLGESAAQAVARSSATQTAQVKEIAAAGDQSVPTIIEHEAKQG